MWTAFINWGPVRAARIFLGHIGLVLVCLLGIWLVEHAFGWLFQEHEPKIVGWVPVRWIFEIGEAAMLIIFMASGIYEAYRELRR
jgi:uncharacterized membrane protein